MFTARQTDSNWMNIAQYCPQTIQYAAQYIVSIKLHSTDTIHCTNLQYYKQRVNNIVQWLTLHNITNRLRVLLLSKILGLSYPTRAWIVLVYKLKNVCFINQHLLFSDSIWHYTEDE
jgi:hypothetical protein